MKKCQKFALKKLLDCLFSNPFYAIISICNELAITRNTATKYFKILLENDLIKLSDSGKTKVYVNPKFPMLLYS